MKKANENITDELAVVATRVVTDTVATEDITLTGAGDESALVEVEDITLSTVTGLNDSQKAAIVSQYKGQFKRPAFVGTVTGIGVAIEHENGYWPVPDFWYQCDYYHQNMDYAMELNRELFDLDEVDAHTIIASTMRGIK